MKSVERKGVWKIMEKCLSEVFRICVTVKRELGENLVVKGGLRQSCWIPIVV